MSGTGPALTVKLGTYTSTFHISVQLLLENATEEHFCLNSPHQKMLRSDLYNHPHELPGQVPVILISSLAVRQAALPI